MGGADQLTHLVAKSLNHWTFQHPTVEVSWRGVVAQNRAIIARRFDIHADRELQPGALHVFRQHPIQIELRSRFVLGLRGNASALEPGQKIVLFRQYEFGIQPREILKRPKRGETCPVPAIIDRMLGHCGAARPNRLLRNQLFEIVPAIRLFEIPKLIEDRVVVVGICKNDPTLEAGIQVI